jgi:hypothetical protein
MAFFRPLPRSVTRPVCAVLVITWIGSMAVLVKRAYVDAAANLATDLARYVPMRNGAACITAVKRSVSPSPRRFP